MHNLIIKTKRLSVLILMSSLLFSCSSTAEQVTTAPPLPADTQPSLPTNTQLLPPTNTAPPLPTDTLPSQPTFTEAIPPTPTQILLPPTETAPSISGATLLDTRCTVCHSKSRVTGARKTYDGWNQTVNRMVLKGAALSPEEILILVEYLAQTYK